ncbi:hypothetical protein SAMD00019534_023200 [Acytostelium subglobosum LB1]|uniref:hypothetical protein n=1 Tax=Acytostelium subglobosum LB1 TaxID=1410327 RepID=UPI0006447E8C|nr:hypothetical protein SAMD00019534_023200 [Acytostelium subglobosum LB1]GAM19145.1 hypothetical protein SAMD00019534_023200 [Acytostelium subglobosum LB1]|eukprot:XP_012757072.1 hypothetical protein SAMD00019534_023200 [Acytostelium subglobosum LB1]
MKFGKYLERHQVSEWRKKYVYYKLFKKQIKAIKRSKIDGFTLKRSTASIVGSMRNKTKEKEVLEVQVSMTGIVPMSPVVNAGEQRMGKMEEREVRRFEEMLEEEFKKVNAFYKEREEEFIRQFNMMKDILLTLPEKGARAHNSMSLSHVFNGVSKRRFSLSSSSHRGGGSGKPQQLHSSGDTSTRTTIEELSIDSPNPNGEIRSAAVQAESYTPKLKPTKIKRTIKRSMQENYREVEILKEYVQLNHTAFRKIFKKYDKALGAIRSAELMAKAEQQYYYTSKKISAVEIEIEALYTSKFAKGNRREAMTHLRINKNHRAPASVVFQTGLYTGFSFILLIFSIRQMVGNVSLTHFDHALPVDFFNMFLLFRCLLLPLLMVWYFGIIMYVCKDKKINDVLILGWDPRSETNHQHVFLMASMFTFAWSTALYLYVYTGTTTDIGRLPIIFPFLLFASVVLFIINPTELFNRPGRYWLLNTFRRIFSAPMLTVKFKDFFFGDQYVSLALVLSDLENTVCYFVYDLWFQNGTCWKYNPYLRPTLLCVPSLLRGLQSLRRYQDSKQRIHLWNLGKYSTNVLLVIINAIANAPFSTGAYRHPLIAVWVIIAVISTGYGCAWDFLMDWDLLQRKSRNKWLRDHLVYRHKSVYYWAMSSNMLLRLTWTINVGLAFTPYTSKQKELILLCTALLEVTRRFQWNFFRLENEHLNNVGKFRAFDLKIPEMYKGALCPSSLYSTTPTTTPTPSPMDNNHNQYETGHDHPNGDINNNNNNNNNQYQDNDDGESVTTLDQTSVSQPVSQSASQLVT